MFLILNKCFAAELLSYKIKFKGLGSGVARWRGRGGGGGPPRVSHFRVTPFCNTSQTEKKTTICLISLEMLITLKLIKK